MKKMLAVLFVVCLACGIGKAQESTGGEAKTLAPGAIMTIYSITENGMPAPGADPLEVVLDSSEGFSRNNLKKYKDTEAHYRACNIIAWEGYLNIPADGEYVFSGKSFDGNKVNFYINEKKVLFFSSSLRDDSSFTASKSLRMKQGDYKVQLYLASPQRNHYEYSMSSSFTLQFWSKSNPIKKFPVSPAKLYHLN